MLKTIDPQQTWEWSSPQAPDSVFTYRAFSGAHLAFDFDVVSRIALDECIVKATNIEVKVLIRDEKGKPTDKWETKEFDEFRPAEYPEVKMSQILCHIVATGVFTAIWDVSSISRKESGE